MPLFHPDRRVPGPEEDAIAAIYRKAAGSAVIYTKFNAKPPPIALKMTDLSHGLCDWRRRLCHMKVTDSNFTKYDWRRRLGGGGAGI